MFSLKLKNFTCAFLLVHLGILNLSPLAHAQLQSPELAEKYRTLVTRLKEVVPQATALAQLDTDTLVQEFEENGLNNATTYDLLDRLEKVAFDFNINQPYLAQIQEWESTQTISRAQLAKIPESFNSGNQALIITSFIFVIVAAVYAILMGPCSLTFQQNLALPFDNTCQVLVPISVSNDASGNTCAYPGQDSYSVFNCCGGILKNATCNIYGNNDNTVVSTEAGQICVGGLQTSELFTDYLTNKGLMQYIVSLTVPTVGFSLLPLLVWFSYNSPGALKNKIKKSNLNQVIQNTNLKFQKQVDTLRQATGIPALQEILTAAATHLNSKSAEWIEIDLGAGAELP